MRSAPELRAFVALVMLGVASAACDSSTATEESAIAITLSANSVALAQGSSTPLTIAIARTNFDKPITLSVDDVLPPGMTATFAENPVAGTATTAMLTIAIAPTTNPASGTFTIRATAEGVTPQTQTVDFSVSVTGTYTLSALAPSLSVAQGGGGSATMLLTRTGGNGGNVSLSVTGLPAGVTASVAQSPTGDRSVPIVFTALAETAAGTYDLTISSSQPGISPDQTTNLSLVVVPAPSTTSVSIPFCSSNAPVWFGFQNEGYLWQQVTPSGSTFSFPATERLGIAFVFASTGQSEVNVTFFSRAELEALDDIDCNGTRNFTGTVTGLTTGQSGLVIMGRAAALTDAAGAYALASVASRPLDLVATRGSVIQNAYITPDRFIIRRGLDLASGATIPTLDFTAAESFTPFSSTLTIAGVQPGEIFEFQNALLTATNTYGALHIASPVGTSATLNSVPVSQLAAGDVHQLFSQAFVQDFTSGHGAVEYFLDPGDRTVTLGSALATPAASTISTTPFARMRATLASQPDYETLARFTFAQGTLSTRRFVVSVVTSAFLGLAPTTWEAIHPDFTGAPGFNPVWMLEAGQFTQFLAEAFSGRGELLFGSPPVVGDVYRTAFRELPPTTAVRLRADGPRRGAPVIGVAPQYFRR